MRSSCRVSAAMAAIACWMPYMSAIVWVRQSRNGAAVQTPGRK